MLMLLTPWINMITSSCLWSKQLTRRNFTLPTKGLFKQLIVYDRSSVPANGSLYNPDGSKRIADNTLVALTLMIAESRTEEKDVMVKVVVNLINRNN